MPNLNIHISLDSHTAVMLRKIKEHLQNQQNVKLSTTSTLSSIIKIVHDSISN